MSVDPKAPDAVERLHLAALAGLRMQQARPRLSGGQPQRDEKQAAQRGRRHDPGDGRRASPRRLQISHETDRQIFPAEPPTTTIKD